VDPGSGTEPVGSAQEAVTGCIPVQLTPKAAVASSIQGPSWPAHSAIDGNLTTRWASAFSDPQWIYVDYGATVVINEVKIYWQRAFSADYDVQVSSDLKTWSTVYTKNPFAGGTDDSKGLSATGRYLRIFAHKRATTYGDSIFEIEAFGSTSVSCANLLKGPWTFAGADFSPSNVYTVAGDAIDFAYQGISFTWGPNGFTGIHFTQPVSLVQGGHYALTLNVTNTSGVPTVFDATLSGAGLPTNEPAGDPGFQLSGSGSETLNFVVSAAPGTAPTIDLLNHPVLAGFGPGISGGQGLNDFTVSATLTRTQ
jgi:hypothetical protein